MFSRDIVTIVLVIIVLLTALALIMGAVGMMWGDQTTPEITQTILLVIGLGGLVSLLIVAVMIYKSLGLDVPNSAFGLPEGTIRAIIAIGLILIFSMVSVFIYYQVKTPPTSEKLLLTQEQFKNVPAESIISSSIDKDNSELFDVVLSQPRNTTSDDIAKQLLTTIGTLAVAVAGFYFGTQSSSGQKVNSVSKKPEIVELNKVIGTAGNPKALDIEITGKNLQSIASVKLKNGENEMDLGKVEASTAKIKGKLTIPAGQAPGKYALVLVGEDGTETKLNDAFEVKSA